MNKLFKYKLLRHVPGPLGYRYECKYRLWTDGFDEAVRRSTGMTCIDLGANLGTFTRKMASDAGKVIAFEPDPWTYATLQANVADLDNVRFENAAAGTREEVVFLFRHGQFDENRVHYSEASSVIASKSDVIEEGSVEVRQIDFIGYLEELDENVAVLKIDIEGAEVDILEALFERPDILKRINYIFAETHESRIPEHKPRVKALRTVARRLKHPYVNLYWH